MTKDSEKTCGYRYSSAVVASWIRNCISGLNFGISSAGARFIIKDCNVGSVCVTV